jgi:hypothetical protein
MNVPTLPTVSSRQLLMSSVIALLVAAVVVFVVVLPAEYGRDPTRLGRLLGLTAMGEAKAIAAASGGDFPLAHAHERKYRTAVIDIAVKPKEELEYKAVLAKGEPLLYAWRAQGGELYFEFHGDPTEGEWPKNYFRSYEIKERSTAAQGSFTAPFTGQHGWYWRNLSDTAVTITLEVSGYYSKVGRID